MFDKFRENYAKIIRESVAEDNVLVTDWFETVAQIGKDIEKAVSSNFSNVEVKIRGDASVADKEAFLKNITLDKLHFVSIQEAPEAEIDRASIATICEEFQAEGVDGNKYPYSPMVYFIIRGGRLKEVFISV